VALIVFSSRSVDRCKWRLGRLGQLVAVPWPRRRAGARVRNERTARFFAEQASISADLEVGVQFSED
jgi:hypothetical protein